MKPKVSKAAIEWSKKKNPPLMDPIERDLLIKYVKECKIHFVEIGTYKGGSAAMISKYLPSGINLTTIDIFRKAPKVSTSQPSKEKIPTYEEAKRTIEKEGKKSKVKIIKGNSWKISKEWKRKIDVLFIDGDHSYEGVKKDFTSWEPHLVRGGYILFHDANFKGVKRFLKEILKNSRFSFKERTGNLAVIKKLD